MRRINCRDVVLLIGICSILVDTAKAQQPMPQLRDRSVVESMLLAAPAGSTDRPLRVVLLAGPKDHGLNEHDYPLWQRRWKVLLGGKQEGDEPILNTYGAPLPVSETDLAGAKNVTVSTAWIKPTPQQWQTADLIVMNCAPSWDAEMIASLQAFLERGGGFVVVHLAMWQESPALAQVIGAAKQPATEFRHGPVQLEIVAPADAITASLPSKIDLVDESYFNFQGDLADAHVLAVSRETRQGETQVRPEPMFWTRQCGEGRVFVCVPGHYMWTFDDPVFRLLLLRGMAWAANQSPSRFDTLVLRGARLAESAPAVPVTPEEPRADDPDLLLWLSASDRATLATDDDQAVSSWKNKATRIGHAVTATGNARPQLQENALGAQSAIRFDGRDDVLSCTDFAQSTDQWTLLMVVVPQSNQGSGVPDGFRGFFSSNEHRQQDFVTGINVDMGATQTDRFWCLNVEGAAGAGATNLLFTATDFGQPRVLTITASPEQMNLLAESIPQGSRGAGVATTSLAEIRIGARYYFQNQATGFVHADIAEILLYRTCLPTDRLLALSKYLETKYGVQTAAIKISQYTLEDAITGLAAYDWDRSRESLGSIDTVIRSGDQQAISRLEQQLIEAMEKGVPPGATDFICRRLAVIGSSACVTPLARLLQDPERSGPALAALQRIPAGDAGQQLIEQLPQTEGATQLGIVNAIGQRREVAAVDELLRMQASENAETARAAAAALAEIAEPRTVPALIESWQQAPQLLLRLAERLAERHETELAQSVYKQLATNPDNAVPAAVLQGLVSLDPDQSAQLLTGALRGNDIRLVGQAAQLLAHSCAEPIVQQVISGFPDLPHPAQQTLLGMRWTRLPEIGHQLGRLGVAQADPDTVESALRLLALHGVREDVPQLSGLAANATNQQVGHAAGLALQHLAAPDTDQAIVECLLTAESQQRLALIRAITRSAFATRRTGAAGSGSGPAWRSPPRGAEGPGDRG